MGRGVEIRESSSAMDCPAATRRGEERQEQEEPTPPSPRGTAAGQMIGHPPFQLGFKQPISGRPLPCFARRSSNLGSHCNRRTSVLYYCAISPSPSCPPKPPANDCQSSQHRGFPLASSPPAPLRPRLGLPLRLALLAVYHPESRASL